MNLRRAVLAISIKSLGLVRGAVFGLYQGLDVCHQSLRFRLGVGHLYKPRPDDIFLVTYPKSGTTLLQMMLYQMTTSGDMDFPHIYSVSPWFEEELIQFAGRGLEAAPSPRLFKSHLRYEKMPRAGRFIYMIRDPRDVAISAYHHHRLMPGRPPGLDRFIDRFLVRRRGSWFDHMASWFPHRREAHVLFLRYEEVIADLTEAVRTVARFCEIPLEEANLPRIVERCSVAFMKRHEGQFDPRQYRLRRNAGTFIRNGAAGEGKAAFNADQSRKLAERMVLLAQKLGAQNPGEAWQDV